VGLDVYVGPFSRYYAGDWETIVQQLGREGGLHVEIVRRPPQREGFLKRFLNFVGGRNRHDDPAAVVNEWMSELSRYAPNGETFYWVDNPEGEYFTEKPAWDCYGALVSWAAYDEAAVAPLPPTAAGWEKDPVYQAAAASPQSRYRHLLANTEVWLPGDFDPPFSGHSPSGDGAMFGSSIRLVGELESLNERTWQADPVELEQWRSAGAEYGAPLETSAKFGFAVFHHLATMSVNRRLPMKLDY